MIDRLDETPKLQSSDYDRVPGNGNAEVRSLLGGLVSVLLTAL